MSEVTIYRNKNIRIIYNLDTRKLRFTKTIKITSSVQKTEDFGSFSLEELQQLIDNLKNDSEYPK